MFHLPRGLPEVRFPGQQEVGGKAVKARSVQRQTETAGFFEWIFQGLVNVPIEHHPTIGMWIPTGVSRWCSKSPKRTFTNSWQIFESISTFLHRNLLETRHQEFENNLTVQLVANLLKKFYRSQAKPKSQLVDSKQSHFLLIKFTYWMMPKNIHISNVYLYAIPRFDARISRPYLCFSCLVK